jgi:hypothetical protein
MKNTAEITASAIYKITDRISNKLCYAVPSDSQPGHYYKTCWNTENAAWECTCEAGFWAAKAGRSANCKHSKAAQTSIMANKTAEVAAMRHDEPRGTLNGNRGFSLLK